MIQRRPQLLDLAGTEYVNKTNGVGLVVPFDFALDDEYWRWLPEDVSLYITRTPAIKNTAVTAKLAKAVGDTMAVQTAVGSLMAAKPLSIGYACTSGSFVSGLKGEAILQAAMHDAGAPFAVTTSGALVHALRRIGAKRVALATPYNLSLTKMLGKFLEAAGFTVVANGYLGKESNIMHVPYSTVRSLAYQVDCADADAIFFSCTNLRTFDVIEELEKELGKPILSANQVTMWSMLRLAGLPLPALSQQLFTLAADETSMDLEVVTVPV